MRHWLMLLLSAALVLGGCSTAPKQAAQEEQAQPVAFNEQDPYESFNRRMFAFNMALHNSVGKPVADAYNSLPSPIRTGIGNFFTNLGTPLTVIHDILQGKVEKAATDFMRFAVNTVFGFGGLLDIAGETNMGPYQPEDLGQTLYTWGLWEGASYLMLPVLGPYTTRELAGGVVDAWADPAYNAILDANGNVKAALRTLDGLDTYARTQPLLDQLGDQPDAYVFVRESYLQYRLGLLFDGDPPEPDIDDIDLE